MKKTNKITKILAAAVAAIMMTTTSVSFMASADNEAAAAGSSISALWDAKSRYNGHPIIEDSYFCDSYITIPFKYSDGFFEEDPNTYDNHMAIMSDALAEARAMNCLAL